jgi:DNA polymerase-3 subunit gamma/tau
VGASIRQRYSEQAAKCQPQFLYKAMKLCNDCDMSYRASKNRRLLVELTLIQVAQAAAGDDDLSGGRSPKRQLKPIFSAAQGAQPADGQSAAAPQSSTSAQQPAAQPQQPAPQAAWQQPAPARQKQQAQQGQAPAQQQPAAQTTADPSSQYQTAVHQPSGSLAEQLRGGGQNATHKVPLMSRNSLSFSIKGGAQQNAATQQQPGGAQQPMPGAQTAAGMPQPMAGAQQNGGAQPSAGAGPATDKPFTDRELNYYWQFYAGQLPKEYVATARRMQMIRPALQPDGVTFSITVDNELTERNFKEMSRDITTYLRKCLQNNRVQMTIRISEATEAVRPVGRVERFQMMAKKNPSLLKLRQELGLELY